MCSVPQKYIQTITGGYSTVPKVALLLCLLNLPMSASWIFTNILRFPLSSLSQLLTNFWNEVQWCPHIPSKNRQNTCNHGESVTSHHVQCTPCIVHSHCRFLYFQCRTMIDSQSAHLLLSQNLCHSCELLSGEDTKKTLFPALTLSVVFSSALLLCLLSTSSAVLPLSL